VYRSNDARLMRFARRPRFSIICLFNLTHLIIQLPVWSVLFDINLLFMISYKQMKERLLSVLVGSK
jgi:hypothetical protein